VSTEPTTIEGAGLRPITQPTIVENVTGQLRRWILAGAVGPGERIVEDRLTERFGVSRPPIREAMRLLEQEGLVQRMPRRGVIVTPLTQDDVREIYSLRWALERLALELAMPIADLRRLDPLRDAVEAMRSAGSADDADALLDANVDFHIALCRLAGHKRLLETYERLMQQLRLCMAINLRLRRETTGDAIDAAERHEKLLALIEAGDTQAALVGLAEHGDREILERPDALAPTEEEG
jgi:DNA-binding GntR family transcriptional regulator